MSYWQDRQLERFQRSEKLMEDYYRELEKAFEQAQEEVSGIIYRFYERYAKDNKISLADAKRALSPSELRNFKASLKEFEQLARDSIGTFNLELENLSTKSRITRYEALQAEIKAALNQLYDRDFEQAAGKTLQNVYVDAYSRLNFDFDRYIGMHHHFARVNTEAVETLLKYPFNGLDFSERIWRQNADLECKIKQALTTAFVQGKNPFDLSKEFAKTFDVKLREAYRLLNTEAAFIQGQATADGYKETGVKHYEICATLDGRTSQICRNQDGKVYEVAKMVVGVNYPPFHPYCRTTTVPVIEGYDKSKDTRVARDKVTGKSVKVPATMSYKEWKARVDKKYSADLKAYEEIKESGLRRIPNVDIFLEQRYNNSPEYLNLIQRLSNIQGTGRWRAVEFNPQTAENHFERHGPALELESLREYNDSALRFVNETQGKEMIIADDGVRRFYLPSSNEFASVHPDGTISTYFKPRQGKKYWERQVAKYGEKEE